MITDINNLCAKIDLLPISKAGEVLKSAAPEDIDTAAAFMASDELISRSKYWERVNPMKIMPAVIYLGLLANSKHPQPESDFTEEFGNIPAFFWAEIINESLDTAQIQSIIKHHKQTVASVIEYLIAALPAKAQAQAVQDSISIINPKSEHFDSLWHTVSDDAREKLRAAFPKCEQAMDIIQKFANISAKDFNAELLSKQNEIKTKDCDKIIELALLRFAADADKKNNAYFHSNDHKDSKEQTLEFVKTQKQIIGGASNARMESLLCRSVVLTHEKQAPVVKKYLVQQFVASGNELILFDAPGKIKSIANKLNDREKEYNNLNGIFNQVAENVSYNANVEELLLSFRIALLQSGLQSDMSYKAIPELLSRQEGVSHEFFWKFRCDYGISVLGIMPPKEQDPFYGKPDPKAYSVLGLELPELTPESYKIIEKSPDVIDISKKNSAMVFSALYNYAWPQGMGFVQYMGIPMTVGDAAQLLNRGAGNERYLAGRAMMLRMDNKTNILDVSRYNHDNGCGIAQRAIRTVPNVR